MNAIDEMPTDALLEEQRRIVADILNDELTTTFDVRRLALITEQLDARIHGGGALPKEWADAQAKAEEADHVRDAISKAEASR